MELLKMIIENYEFIIDNHQKQDMFKELKYYFKKIIKINKLGRY